MVRLLIVATLLAFFVLAKIVHDRRRSGLADRSTVEHPSLPVRFRGSGRTWVVFATEYCATCGPVVERLGRLHPADTVVKILVEDEPALAESFSVRTAPTVLEVDPSGEVAHSVAGTEPVLAYVGSLAGA